MLEISSRNEAFAVRLMEDGLNTADDTVGRYVMLEMASKTAADSGDIETALKAIDHIVVEYEIDRLAVKLQALDSLEGELRDREAHKELVSQANALVEEA